LTDTIKRIIASRRFERMFVSEDMQVYLGDNKDRENWQGDVITFFDSKGSVLGKCVTAEHLNEEGITIYTNESNYAEWVRLEYSKLYAYDVIDESGGYEFTLRMGLWYLGCKTNIVESKKGSRSDVVADIEVVGNRIIRGVGPIGGLVADIEVPAEALKNKEDKIEICYKDDLGVCVRCGGRVYKGYTSAAFFKRNEEYRKGYVESKELDGYVLKRIHECTEGIVKRKFKMIDTLG
jgi:hypothetical protein